MIHLSDPGIVRQAFPQRRRVGFTLPEALIALVLAGMASSSLLLATYASMYQTTDVSHRSLAMGAAEQLLDEIAGLPYKEKGTSAYATVLGPESGETSRPLFDDMDDFNGYQQPGVLTDRFDVQLGQGDGAGGLRDPQFAASPTYFRWQATVSVAYVNESDTTQTLPAGQTSGARRVDVMIQTTGGVELARVSRVVAYVPSE